MEFKNWRGTVFTLAEAVTHATIHDDEGAVENANRTAQEAAHRLGELIEMLHAHDVLSDEMARKFVLGSGLEEIR
jgi:hypothetical protein